MGGCWCLFYSLNVRDNFLRITGEVLHLQIITYFTFQQNFAIEHLHTLEAMQNNQQFIQEHHAYFGQRTGWKQQVPPIPREGKHGLEQ